MIVDLSMTNSTSLQNHLFLSNLLIASILRSDRSPMSNTAGRRRIRSTNISLFLNRWPLLLLLIIIIFLQLASCHKNTDPPNYCPSSTCGDIQNISYPFRLNTDPPNCGSGDGNFTLYCHNNNSTLFLYLNNDLNSARFLVKGINYDNLTIHLVDPGIQQHNCSSLPISPISIYPYGSSDLKYTTNVHSYGMGSTALSKSAVFVSCDEKRQSYLVSVEITAPRKRIIKSKNQDYVEIPASCRSRSRSKKYSYVILGLWWLRGYSVYLRDLTASCSIDMMTLVPYNNYTKNVTMTSYLEFHRQLSYGFQLSWYHLYCPPDCSGGKGNCYLDEANNRPACYYPRDQNKKYYHIRAWFLFIYGPFLARKNYWAPIFKITSWLIIILTPVGAYRVTLFLLGSPLVFAFLIYKWRRRHLSLYDTVEEFLQNHNDLMPIRYSYKDIKKITLCFKDKLEEGGFGCVYKGKLRGGNLAAIKILGKSSKVTNGQDFMNEVATIGRIHYVNVVRLVGYCAEQSRRALVYDFMPNGSLDKYIFPKQGLVSLSWEKLFDISIGVARGIEYLHRGCDMQILHFDIKPHNILLDENFIPKISEFGLAKLYPTAKDTIASLTAARGTIGYMAPELFYKNIGRVSYKADVYSFGMLLLEIAGKRKNLNAALVENSSQMYFPSWVHDEVSNGDDIEIGGGATEEETKIMKKMIIVGLWCIQMKPNNRPSMNRVVEMLEGDVESLQIPPKQALCPEEMPNVAETDEFFDMSNDSSESISLIGSTD